LDLPFFQHSQDKKCSSGSIGSLDPIKQKEVTVKTPGQKNPKPTTVKKATLKADLVRKTNYSLYNFSMLKTRSLVLEVLGP
jgi:hypothetical protein